jgi:uncharacterized protein YggU (UPF0235/DUF167 family)
MNDGFSDLLSAHDKGVRLAVKAKPGLSRSRPPKIVALADGKRAVEIAVAAVAEDGRANRALLDFLAEATGLRKADLSIRVGGGGRLKLIDIAGDPAALRTKVSAWLAGLDGKA